MIQSLATLTLAPFVRQIARAIGVEFAADIAGGTGTQLVNYFTDHSQKIRQAILRSNNKAWDALEIALSGDSWFVQAKQMLSEQDKRAVADEFHRLLPDLTNKARVRQQCLEQLRAARNAGVLDAANLDVSKLPDDLHPFLVSADLDHMRTQADRELCQFAELLKQHGYESLAWLLEQRSADGSLLVAASRYFFRREVEKDVQLFRGIAFAQLETLTQTQQDGFEALANVLDTQGQKLDEIHGTALDLQEEQRQYGQLLEDLYAQVREQTRRLDLLGNPLRPQHSLSIRSETERVLIKELMARFRSLPLEQQGQLPALLNAIAKLEVAAGSFADAETHFGSVAAMTTANADKAEAHHNAYLAALEKKDYQNAFEYFHHAVKLDPDRWAPFPLETYEPTKILGAGGFGVAFLCKHCHLYEHVVIKALHQTELDRTLDEVFKEAQVLRKITHPAIIELRDCGYADATNKARPYLVMEYFDGLTLEEHVKRTGPFGPDEFKPVAQLLLQALGAAHDQGILHRDVKPANVLVRKAGADWQVKLIDFGLAVGMKAVHNTLQGSAAGMTTMIGQSVAGTLGYASPEQLGQSPGVSVGPQSDIYGFGKTCYYALLNTPDPDDDERESLPDTWRQMLGKCATRKTTKRYVNIAAFPGWILNQCDESQIHISSMKTACPTTPKRPRSHKTKHHSPKRKRSPDNRPTRPKIQKINVHQNSIDQVPINNLQAENSKNEKSKIKPETSKNNQAWIDFIVMLIFGGCCGTLPAGVIQIICIFPENLIAWILCGALVMGITVWLIGVTSMDLAPDNFFSPDNTAWHLINAISGVGLGGLYGALRYWVQIVQIDLLGHLLQISLGISCALIWRGHFRSSMRSAKKKNQH